MMPFLVLLLCLLTSPAVAENILNVLVVSVFDGDTVFVDIPWVPAVFGDRLGIRLLGIDTPEIHGKCLEEKWLAVEARAFLEGQLALAKRVDLLEVSRDKYFRVDAIVQADGKNLNDALVNAGLAVRYDGGTKVNVWCPTQEEAVHAVD